MKKHITQNGERINFSEMEDSHLINTINFHLKKVVKLESMMKKENTNDITSLLYDIDLDIEEIKEKIVRIYDEILPHYVMEACIRGINVTDILQGVFKRKEQLTFNTDELLELGF